MRDLQSRDKVAAPDDLLEMAWVVIANAGWDGMPASPGWQEAAVKWRDDYHRCLRATTPAPAGAEG